MARKPFKAVPLHAVGGRTGYRPPQRSAGRWFVPAMVALPAAAFTAVFFWPGAHDGGAVELPHAGARDTESAAFAPCQGPVRVNCVVDGDTFWYRGEKIRIADINTPEVSEPDCAYEADLGAQATARLEDLLNQGAFTLEPGGDGRDTDRYGRLLRVVTRRGESLGQVLVDEGLAEEWKGYRGEWC